MTDMPPSSSGQPSNGGSSGRGPVHPQGTAYSPPPPPHGYMMAAQQPTPSAQRRIWGRLGTSVLTTVVLLSLGLNLYLGMFVMAYAGGGPREAVYEEGSGRHRIVVLPIEEMVTDSTYTFVRRALRALKDDPPAALVLRIDCPGGTVAASDRIWHDLNRFKEETGIPVVASFGSVAASGGYYVAMPADTILAEPTTITGSIGVIVMGFTVHELLEKVGVTPEIVTSTGSTKKDNLLPTRPWSNDERRELVATRLDPAYERFVGVVQQGRGHLLDEQQIRDRATGEVFSAQQAHDLQLVDGIGYLDDAIARAKEQAGLDDSVQPRVTIIRQPQGFGLLNLFAASSGGRVDMSWPDLRQVPPDQLRAWLLEMTAPRVMYGTPG